MKYDRILIRYGELTLKGRNRKFFVRKLKNNIRMMLRGYPKTKIETLHDRMYVLLNGEPYDQVREKLSKVFGIQSFSPAIRTEKDLDQIKAAALHIVKQAHIPGGT